MRLTDEALRAETARAVLIKPRGYNMTTLPMLTSWDFKRNDEGDLDLVEVQNKPTSFMRNGLLYISMEHGDGAGDYNGHYSIDGEEQDGIPYIAEVILDWAKKNKGYFEWHDGGTIVFNKD